MEDSSAVHTLASLPFVEVIKLPKTLENRWGDGPQTVEWIPSPVKSNKETRKWKMGMS
jgi:hypothetical protein